MDIAVLKALADPTRLRIIALLQAHTYCVRALAQLLEMSESAVSQHLKVLREAELVEGVKYGYYTHYRIRREALEALYAQLGALLNTERTPHKGKGCDVSEQIGCRRVAEKGGSSPC